MEEKMFEMSQQMVELANRAFDVADASNQEKKRLQRIILGIVVAAFLAATICFTVLYTTDYTVTSMQQQQMDSSGQQQQQQIK